ncbi:MAG: hypothetical protein SVU32_06420, partial [Candidatus Nanohaloarchaea archaeon]|nr:hypothetical protein [Candidatus Nanohaloarchaea archaeon]
LLLSKTDDTADAPVPGVDWDTTTAFYDRGWGLKIIEDNLDQDYDSFRDQLMEELKQVTDDENDPVFADVRKGEDIYHGPHMDQYKDIYLMPSGKYYLTRLLKDHLIDDKEISHKKRVQANHNNNPEGVFIAYGQDFAETGLETIQIYDILPTLLHLHDISLPNDLDGEVITQAFKDESDAASREVQYGSAISEEIDV